MLARFSPATPNVIITANRMYVNIDSKMFRYVDLYDIYGGDFNG